MSAPRETQTGPIVAVAAAAIEQGRVLVVRRTKPPNANRLALPGGRVEPGESLFEAAVRELREETGVEAEAERVMTAVEEIQHDAQRRLLYHYVIVVVSCRWLGGEAVAGDDASEIRWLDRRQIAQEPELCENTRWVAAALYEELYSR
ncbi:NUDIX hydrolase [Halomonas sp. MCCC 1A11062]|uniref:NUDIX hydrolase n=1 Tax=Halomonas sp. MCCC 1A11062 TaxID=2733485 RepID=UPI001F41D69E|nr:NUDIX hydrolase [Halomonas sp. MCCC 1A11062]MCE8038157.1 NUDIX hydrolase [Halomonas sp. MCCC 1A11062]